MIPPFRKAKIQSSLKWSLAKGKLKRYTGTMAWLDLILLMKALAAASETQSVAEKSKVIQPHHVRAVRKVVFRKLRG
ncbi:hypothetical protein V1264_023039 [Littorina saxatilis]|uniref:Centromere protein W n=1 Tax=Littorina saxatilis TaxID=31220 RepID=A0AAN9B6G6_9CAEN